MIYMLSLGSILLTLLFNSPPWEPATVRGGSSGGRSPEANCITTPGLGQLICWSPQSSIALFMPGRFIRGGFNAHVHSVGGHLLVLTELKVWEDRGFV
jgi:hypothetical protein